MTNQYNIVKFFKETKKKESKATEIDEVLTFFPCLLRIPIRTSRPVIPEAEGAMGISGITYVEKVSFP